MDESNPTFTPIEQSKDETADTKEAKGMPYRELIGGLLYLSTINRQVIYSKRYIRSRHVENPKHHHWIQAKRILTYLRGTTDYGILYNGNKKLALYSDADFAGNLEDRRSTSGYLLMYSGGAVSWHSRKQRTVALSTAEAEYVSASEAIRKMPFMRKFGLELKMLSKEPTIMYVDNNSAIHMITKKDKKASKHIDIKYHFVKEKIGTEITVEHIATNSWVIYLQTTSSD
ncbi:uncharacterized protein [Centruroides vittatus]|uniref:uncharacterized protein n=1 Tax=Centruroides vittatus TaxID=120091 RepID=UPI00350FB0BD